jgi:hypothetical protein
MRYSIIAAINTQHMQKLSKETRRIAIRTTTSMADKEARKVGGEVEGCIV